MALLLAGVPIFLGILLLFLMAGFSLTGLAWLWGLRPTRDSVFEVFRMSLACAGGLTLMALVGAAFDGGP